MLATRTTYLFNIGWIVLMLVLAVAIGGFTGWAADARDDSTLSWEDSCNVSDVMRGNGAIELRCPSNDGEVILASARSTYIALIGNTAISERAEVPAACRNYQSGRWTCRVGEEEQFYKFSDVTLVKEE